LARQQTNIVAELRTYRPSADADIDRQWRDQLRDAFADIAAQRKTLDAELAALTNQAEAPKPSNPALLDQLPIIEGNLTGLPEDRERDLWAGFQLQVRYHHPTGRATIRVTIDDHTVQRLAATNQTITNPMTPLAQTIGAKKPAAPTSATGDLLISLAGRAPGGACHRSSTKAIGVVAGGDKRRCRRRQRAAEPAGGDPERALRDVRNPLADVVSDTRHAVRIDCGLYGGRIRHLLRDVLLVDVLPGGREDSR
jgi:hypothetical protein